MPRKPYPRYSEDFKKSIVDLYLSGRTRSSLSEEFGIHINTIYKWTQKYAPVTAPDGTTYTLDDIRRLQKEIDQLREDNLILKKAIAIFTPHSENG